MNDPDQPAPPVLWDTKRGPAGPLPLGDREERCADQAANAADDLGYAREMAVRGPGFAQVSGSPSDIGSDGIDHHRAAAEVLARWGAGGLLADVQHLAAQHEPELPAEVEALVAPLAMALAAYAPAGSLSGDLAWRTQPCTLCAGDRLDEVRGDE
ncbi:hypothetical protein [Pseudonocardia hydrocarbonoxydans]|nr:hypothetical protein [Pseudonocardia hydrocarbonoxydans]